MLPLSPSTTAPSSYSIQHQQYDSDTDKDPSTLTSTSTPDSPGRSTAHSIATGYTQSQLHTQNNSHYHNGSAGYLSPLGAPHSSVPQIRSPLAMSFNSQGNSSGAAFNTRSSYNTRIRGRRDSFQQSSAAFSPTLGHNSPNASCQVNLHSGANGIYSHQSRLGYLWPGTGPASVSASGNRNRCLSASSVDSNASSVGLSHLTPALAAMSVQHQQQGSTTNSPYQSYSSSPQQGTFQNHYQQQQHSSSDTSYPYHSPFSSPLPQSQVPAYDSLSMTAASLATSIYGTTPPIHSSADIMYQSPSHYGAASTTSPQNYNSAARYGTASMIPLAPSLYSEQDSTRMSQTQFDSSSPLSTNGPTDSRSFDYADQYQQSQGQYFGQQSQQGLGILDSGGMARAMSSTPDNEDGEDGQQRQQQDQRHSGMKRNTSMSGSLQTADDIHAVIGKDGKTLVYICPKCDPSKVVEFTTKSNLKRHLENKNIHNTPYERRRDQKRWQGHEKKQVSRDETTLRMRKWRNCNPEKNRFNDMRCRVYRNARKIYGEGYSEAKEEYIRSEIERRKQNMIIRNSRRAEWASQATNSNGCVGESSTSPSASPVSATVPGGVGFPMPETAFMFTNPYGASSSMMVDQQIPAYGSTDDASSLQEKSDKQKPDESKFLQDLKENRLPPRRRSRSAMHITPNNSTVQSSENPNEATSVSVGSISFGSRGESPFGPLGSYTDTLGSESFGHDPSSPQQSAIRRLRKQRSATVSTDILRHNQTFASSGTLPGYGVVSSSYNGYMDSNQQLQMLEQKYSSGSMTHGQESLDSVVEAMEITQAMSLGTNETGPTAPSGGLYGDRDASAWLTSSATYNAQNLAGAAHPEDGARGFPFPVIRDRKELARAAGIRLDIPHQHPLAPHHWIGNMNGNGCSTPADDLVGGSATSLESSAISRHEHSPLINSPLSAALSPMPGASSTKVSHGNRGPLDEDEDHQDDSDHVSYNSNSHHTTFAHAVTKSKGSNFEVFGMQSVQMPLYGQSLCSSESGFFTTDAASLTETSYLAKDQGVGRRHSTAMANLSSL